MRLELKRDGIEIFPENEVDAAYIEDTLGLKENGSKLELVRVEATGMGFGQCAHLKAKAIEE